MLIFFLILNFHYKVFYILFCMLLILSLVSLSSFSFPLFLWLTFVVNCFKCLISYFISFFNLVHIIELLEFQNLLQVLCFRFFFFFFQIQWCTKPKSKMFCFYILIFWIWKQRLLSLNALWLSPNFLFHSNKQHLMFLKVLNL